jgi:hypothetical protein
MRIFQVLTAAAFIAAITVSSAGAFEMTQIGGTNSDGSAQYQDPETQQLPAPLGGTVQIQGGFTDNGQGTVPPWVSAASPASGSSAWPYGPPFPPRR